MSAAIQSRYAEERAEPTRAELDQRERAGRRSELAAACSEIEHRFALVEDEPTPAERLAAEVRRAREVRDRARRQADAEFAGAVDAAVAWFEEEA